MGHYYPSDWIIVAHLLWMRLDQATSFLFASVMVQ